MPTQSNDQKLYFLRLFGLLFIVGLVTAGVGYVARAGSFTPAQQTRIAQSAQPSPSVQNLQASCSIPLDNLSLQALVKQGNIKITTGSGTIKNLLYKDNTLYVWENGSKEVVAYANKQQNDLVQIAMSEVTNNNSSLEASLQNTIAQSMLDPQAGFSKYCTQVTDISDAQFALPTDAQIVQK